MPSSGKHLLCKVKYALRCWLRHSGTSRLLRDGGTPASHTKLGSNWKGKQESTNSENANICRCCYKQCPPFSITGLNRLALTSSQREACLGVGGSLSLAHRRRPVRGRSRHPRLSTADHEVWSRGAAKLHHCGSSRLTAWLYNIEASVWFLALKRIKK